MNTYVTLEPDFLGQLRIMLAGKVTNNQVWSGWQIDLADPSNQLRQIKMSSWTPTCWVKSGIATPMCKHTFWKSDILPNFINLTFQAM